MFRGRFVRGLVLGDVRIGGRRRRAVDVFRLVAAVAPIINDRALFEQSQALAALDPAARTAEQQEYFDGLAKAYATIDEFNAGGRPRENCLVGKRLDIR